MDLKAQAYEGQRWFLENETRGHRSPPDGETPVGSLTTSGQQKECFGPADYNIRGNQQLPLFVSFFESFPGWHALSEHSGL